MEIITVEKLDRVFSYEEYKALIARLAENMDCTGEKTPERIEATKLNVHRIGRIEKQCSLLPELEEAVKNIQGKFTWLLIIESWCGDGAQSLPVIAKMAALHPNIELKLILRDEHLSLMDAFLTNGTRAIPRLIFLQNDKVLATWGPRPKAIQEMVTAYKTQHPAMDHQEFVTQLHLWYARDKTQSLQNEFIEILRRFR